MSDAIEMPPWVDVNLSGKLLDICAGGEGQSVEFKECLPKQGHDIGKAIAAFASSGGGDILYGVSDVGAIVGLPNACISSGRDEISRRLLSAAKEVKPPVSPNISWALYDGKVVGVLHVPNGIDPPYFSNHRPMIRRGAASRPAEPDEIDLIYRQRHVLDATAAQPPSTKAIATRMGCLLELLNAGRAENLTAADLARAMGLPSPAALDPYFSGQIEPQFSLLDQFCVRFAICQDWLIFGRGVPFLPPDVHSSLPERYLHCIENAMPEHVYLVLSDSSARECCIVVASDPLTAWRLSNVWQISGSVGATGAASLVSLYRLFNHWLGGRSDYGVSGVVLEEAAFDALINGEVFPGSVMSLPANDWWMNLVDLEYRGISNEEIVSKYGLGFRAAQAKIRALLVEWEPASTDVPR